MVLTIKKAAPKVGPIPEFPKLRIAQPNTKGIYKDNENHSGPYLLDLMVTRG